MTSALENKWSWYIMIYTGNYQNCRKGNLISISGDGGKEAQFNGPCYKTLAPKLGFWKEWHNNIGNIPESINNDFYIHEYEKQVLRNLVIDNVLKELGENPILLCYEDVDQFCHRHIVAAWIELKTGLIVPEIKTLSTGQIVIINTDNDIKKRVKSLILK